MRSMLVPIGRLAFGLHAVTLTGGVIAQESTDSWISGDAVGRLLKSSIVSVPKLEMGVFREITTIDGLKISGHVFWAGRNAILVKGEESEVTLPLSGLSENDFQMFGFQENRSSDARFWWERKRALENERGRRSLSFDDIDSCLARLQAMNPLIEDYERRLESQEPTVIELDRFVRLLNARVNLSAYQWQAVGILVDEFRGIAEVIGSTESRRLQDQTGKLETILQSTKEKILITISPMQKELWDNRKSNHRSEGITSDAR